jgi:cellulose synthase/poly-beta-1,6-N-acetylglucosamine synthase-like glycosyltransferase
MVRETLLWGGLAMAVGCVSYAYVGYPAVLWIIATLARSRPDPPVPDEWPAITIVLPVYNEEHVIAGTLESILALDYPTDRRHVLVISDASTDGTDAIVKQYADRGVELVRLAERGGKTAAENAARSHLRGDIVVNTDASVRLRRDALKPLIAAFGDPTVGVASGRDVSMGHGTMTANVGEAGYVGYEMWVRGLETTVAGIVGASGCFFASRATLHREIVPEALSRDFAAPLIAQERGYRSVSVDDAVCFVPRTDSLRWEYRRKVRTMTRGLDTLFYKRNLLNPIRHGTFAWMLWSHKLARWLVPWAAVVGGVAAVSLALSRPWLWWVLGPAALVPFLATVGWFWPAARRMPTLLAVATYAFFGMVAGLHAWVEAVRGDVAPTWEPTRRAPHSVDVSSH